MTKYQLFAALSADGDANIVIEGRRYILQSVQREDGSGHCFNVVAIDVVAHKPARLFVRTID